MIMTISNKENWLSKNPEWEQVHLGTPRIVTHVGNTINKTSSGWKDLLGEIKKGSGEGDTIKT